VPGGRLSVASCPDEVRRLPVVPCGEVFTQGDSDVRGHVDDADTTLGLRGTDDQPGRGAEVLSGLRDPDHPLVEVDVAAPQTCGFPDA